jgi:TusA-related sulfurtransferase
MLLSIASYPSVTSVVDCDIRGQMCPSTLLSALREVNARKHELRDGAVTLCLHTDNREATITIPEALQNMGYEVAVDKEGAHYRITVGATFRRG